MIINNISLSNYRNYSEEEVFFSGKTNIVYGNNAQGKTNLLEAIYIFSSGKSYRTQNDGELIKNGCGFCRVLINFEAYGRENECEIIFKDGKKKVIKLNKIPLRKTSELLGIFKITFFGPEELFLINGSPETRRYFINMHISSAKPIYYKLLKDYVRFVRQKNNLLKKIQFDETLKDTLFVWNEKIAELGAGITFLRNEYIEKLSPIAQKFHNEISSGKERLTLKYNPNSGYSDLFDKDKIKKEMLKHIEKREYAEIAQGQALVGPHRDDMEFLINGFSAKSYASQGQQRTAVISVKCAQTELIKDECGEYPVLLLDDIMSELDKERRSFLTEKIKNMQVIMTCTEADVINIENEKKYFYIKNGKVDTNKYKCEGLKK